MKKLIVNAMTLAILVSAPAPSHAATSQTTGYGDDKIHTAKGFSQEQLYFSIGGAEVDAFNFNLVMSMSEQLGFGMPVDGGLSLSLSRVYNSNLYSSKTTYTHLECDPYPDGTTGRPLNTSKYLEIPRQNPMGLGWQFHLGRIYKAEDVYCANTLQSLECYEYQTGSPQDLTLDGPWTYVTPDGAEHQLFEHGDDSTAAGLGVTVYYAWDGSKIKAVHTEPAGSNDHWEVFLPDGTIIEMKHEVEGQLFGPDLGYYDEPPANICNDPDETPCTVNADCGGICMGLVSKGDPCTSDQDCDNGNETCALYSCNPNPEVLPEADLEPVQLPGDPDPVNNYTYDRDKVGFHTSRIRGREESSGNVPAAFIDVEYHEPPFGYIISTITDSHSAAAGGTRYIQVDINDTDSTAVDYGKITQVSFPSPPDEMGAPRPRATFDFSYASLPLAMHRGQYAISADVLSRVDMPFGHAISYDYRDRRDTLFAIDEDMGTRDYGGQLTEIINPTGEQIILTYDRYYRKWRDERVDPGYSWASYCTCDQDFETQFIGLKQKQEVLAGGETKTWIFDLDTTLAYDWEFTELRDCGTEHGFECPMEATFWNSVSIMTDPSGTRTEIEYDTSTHSGAFPHADPQDTAFFGKAISELYYEGSSNPVKLVDKTYLQVTGTSCYGSSWAEQDSETTTYLGDLPVTSVTWVKDAWQRPTYKAYGHFGRTTRSGNAIGDFDAGNGMWERIVYTDYAMLNTTCPGWQQLYDNWLPNVVANTSVAISDGTNTEVKELTEFAFDSFTGRVTDSVRRAVPSQLAGSCSRTLDDIAPLDDDIVTSRFYDLYGNVMQEDVKFGAAGSQVFTTHTGWKYGVARSQRTEGAVHYDVYMEDGDIDPGTSLVLRERYAPLYPYSTGDPYHVLRETVYDEMRRPVKEQVGSMEPWRNEYVTKASEIDATRQRLDYIRSYQGADGSDEQVETRQYYDVAGRVFKNEKLNPDGTRAYQHTEFDAAGRTRFVTEWTAAVTCPGTPPVCEGNVAGTRTDYTTDGDGDPDTGESDAFGRPWQVTGPLSEVTRLEYFGTNKKVTVEGVAAPPMVGEMDEVPIDSVTEYFTDGLGRLRAVQQSYTYDAQGPTPDNLPAADAVYEYDYADRLTKVNLVSGFTFSPTANDRYAMDPLVSPQQRTFTFDTLGRQISSDHPESGITTTLAWNVLGAPTQVQDALGVAMGHYHETTYDALGRPTKVERVSTDPHFYERRADFSDWNDNKWDYQVLAMCGFPSGVWYFGKANCRYGQNSAESATLTLTNSVGPVPTGATLSFQYFREVRFDPASSNEDVFTVTIQEDLSGNPPQTELFRIDATQLSWSRWLWSPAIPLDGFAGKNVIIEFDFDSATSNPTPNRGIAIRDVVIKKPSQTILQEIKYDDGNGVSGNKFLGKPAEITVYDEGTAAPVYFKRLIYAQPEGRLSAEEIDVDWDRDGTFHNFESAYEYNAMGQLSSQTTPHFTSEPVGRTYSYAYRHGALTGVVRDGGQVIQPLDIIPDSPGTPGITYNLAGGVASLRYGNGLTTQIDSNAAFLPQRIYVGPSGSPLFDTGTYAYDGARNIKTIGADEYRYDHVGRLARAKVASSGFGSGLILRYGYDMYGNMESRQTQLPGGSVTPHGPVGLHFASRGYDPTKNRIAAPFQYDANGNMIEEPDHDGVNGHRYIFTPENRISYIQSLTDGTPYQQMQYDAEGNRWMRSSSSDGGKVLLTLRGISGEVAAEYEESSATSGMQVSKDYVRANGKLVGINKACGPAPSLSLLSVTANQVLIEKTDYASATSYTMTLETDTTEPTTIGYSIPDPQKPNELAVDTSTWSELTNYRIRLQATMDCGTTALGNAVSFKRQTGVSCVADTVLAHTAIGFGESRLQVMGDASSCSTPPNWVFDLWYFPDVGPATLLASGLATPSKEIPRTSFGAGHGRYSFAERDPVTGNTVPVGGNVRNDYRNTTGQFGEEVGTTTLTELEYVHSDHLGSTRLVTDKFGQEVSHYKFYPFGEYAETVSGSDLRMKFTGHERDEGLNLDYMKARYCGSRLARFLSPDPAIDVEAVNVQSWNLFAYVRSRPLVYLDPSGELHLAFDFSDSTLPVKAQAQIIAQTRDRFINAGAKDVTGGQVKFSDAIDAKHAGEDIVPIRVQGEKLTKLSSKGFVEVLGKTPVTSGLDRSIVSYFRAPAGQEVTFTTNVATHEAGHQTLSELDPHATADPGSVMEPISVEDAADLGEGTREFDNDDAAQLEQR